MSYRMSFTSAGLLLGDSLTLVRIYRELGDWDAVKKVCFEQNLLQAKKPSSAKRNIRELSDRLRNLTDHQMDLLVNGNHADQLQMLWLANLKTYRFLREFCEEVVREKFLSLSYLLDYDDFDQFFNAKAEWDDTLDSLSDSTRLKVRQVLFRMLREAEILTRENMIVPTIFSGDAARAIQEDDPALLAAFPISDLDIQELIR